MDQVVGHWNSEHYKMLVRYDDYAKLRYTDDDGIEQIADGAFYFQNSGGQGEVRATPMCSMRSCRENHADYYVLPIGNDNGRQTRSAQNQGRQTKQQSHARDVSCCCQKDARCGSGISSKALERKGNDGP